MSCRWSASKVLADGWGRAADAQEHSRLQDTLTLEAAGVWTSSTTAILEPGTPPPSDGLHRPAKGPGLSRAGAPEGGGRQKTGVEACPEFGSQSMEEERQMAGPEGSPTPPPPTLGNYVLQNRPNYRSKPHTSNMDVKWELCAP